MSKRNIKRFRQLMAQRMTFIRLFKNEEMGFNEMKTHVKKIDRLARRC